MDPKHASAGSLVTPELRLRAAESFERALVASEVDLPVGPEVGEQLRAQLDAVLELLVCRLDGLSATVEPDEQAATAVGTLRVLRGVPPSVSLQAAGVLFDAVLPLVHEALVTGLPGAPTALQVSLELHRALMGRVMPAAVAYVDVLRERIGAAHREERRRMARELHDQVAHGIGVALQGLEMRALEMSGPPDRRIALADEVLRETLDGIRSMSFDLRDVVGPRGLDEALRSAIDVSAPALRTRLTTAGDLGRLPHFVKEEVFLILREAIRNTVRHATGADLLEVSLAVGTQKFEATVDDNGPGFDVAAAVAARTTGLTSMRERSEILQGSLTVERVPDRGTRVALVVPLPRPAS